MVTKIIFSWVLLFEQGSDVCYWGYNPRTSYIFQSTNSFRCSQYNQLTIEDANLNTTPKPLIYLNPTTVSDVHNITESLLRMLIKRRQNLFTFLSNFVTKQTIFQVFQKQLTLCKGFQTIKQKTCFNFSPLTIHFQMFTTKLSHNWRAN